MFWDQDALSAPHTQRDLDMIEQTSPVAKELHALRVKLDRAQSEVERLKEELAEARRVIFNAGMEAGNLMGDLHAEKVLADRLYDCWTGRENYDEMLTARAAYRKARGL